MVRFKAHNPKSQTMISSLVLLCLLASSLAQTLDCNGVPDGTSEIDACGVCDGDDTSCIDCSGVPNGTSRYDECDVCDGDGTSCCGPNTGRECCVNYSGVPDPYWDFVLLPVTLDNLIEKFVFTRDIFSWLSTNLPDYKLIENQVADLHIGRMAEFNRLFLEECLEEFCERSATIYSQLVFDNSKIGYVVPGMEDSPPGA